MNQIDLMQNASHWQSLMRTFSTSNRAFKAANRKALPVLLTKILATGLFIQVLKIGDFSGAGTRE
jgi:hypothetical protein